MTSLPEIHPENYTIETELDHNEWSTLYQARHLSDGKLVMLRVVAPLFAGDEYFARRFMQISRQSAELEHPNILPVYEAEQDGDALYIVQDSLEARPLAEVIAAEGPFSIRRTQFIVAQIASALDYVHQKSLTHGDLSAHQIYLGPNDHVWLTNLGLSQLLYGTNFARHGLPSQAAETLAPERVRGQGPSRQADLYSLGVLCYQMLSKQLPFSGPSSAVLHAQAYKQPRPLHQVNPGIPLAVSETVERMLSKSVDVRYNTGAEFARALSMAYQRKKSFRSYDRLLPLTEREARRPAGRSVIYPFVGLIAVLAIVALSVWAGYELGLKHSLEGTSFPQGILNSVISTPSPSQQTIVTTVPPRPVIIPALTPFASPTLESLVVLSDRLRPTQTPVRVENARASLITPTLTLTPAITPTFPNLVPLARVLAASTTPQPAAPSNQGTFIFHNPTGYDLIIDLTGPTNASALVPPYLQKELTLALGEYQYIIHTPTGNWLDSKVGRFVMTGGETIQKDYYSQHEQTIPRN